MRIGILRTQVPFVHGGAERHASRLCEALQAYGHEATEISLPLKWYPAATLAQSIVAARATDVSNYNGVPIDLVIGLKFPAWLARHPNKIFWILHQHRQAYDLWENGHSDFLHDPEGLAMRHMIHVEDYEELSASRYPIYANSRNVAGRLHRALGLDATPLYHPPPLAGRFRVESYGDYVFAPGRINTSKRLDLMIAALAQSDGSLRLKVAGIPEDPSYLDELKAMASGLGVGERIDWLGAVTDEEMIQHYAGARAVLFVPKDEDYGYITLEAMLAGRPVITVTDAGGPLEFVRDGQEGLITRPEPDALGLAITQLGQDQALAERMGQAGLARYGAANISWEKVVEVLTPGAVLQEAPRPAVVEPTPPPQPPQPPAPADATNALRRAIAPPEGMEAPRADGGVFADVGEVMLAYEFDTLPHGKGGEGAAPDPGLIAYLGTHWTRFLTTLDLVCPLSPGDVLDVGTFPPLVFEALLANALPGVKMAGVWEGPNPYSQQIKAKASGLPDFDITLRPANIEQDRMPYEDESFDLVLGMEIFEHLALDPHFFLCEAARVLRPGGRILLSTPNVVSHRGVGKVLHGISPYSFGIFVPTGGVYGRHNREYTAPEVARLAQSAGFETECLKTVDVYDTHVDPATAELLSARNDDLALRGETIFYLGRKTGAPSDPPEGFYHGDPAAMSGGLSAGVPEAATGLVYTEVSNRSPRLWRAQGERATCLLAEWISPEGALVHTGQYLPLDADLLPGHSARVPMRLDPSDQPRHTLGRLRLQIFQTGVGSLSGTGRANTLELPCSQDAYLRLISRKDRS